MALTSAVATALNTVELLEHILIHLPVKDVGRAAQTCHFWHNVIYASKLLRRKLFLDADAVREVIASSSPGAPVFRAVLQPIQSHNGPTIMITPQYCTQPGQVIVSVNPILKAKVPEGFPWLNMSLANSSITLHPQSTREDMFLTQPPCKEVDVTFEIADISLVLTDDIFPGLTECTSSGIRFLGPAGPGKSSVLANTRHITIKDSEGVRISQVTESIRKELQLEQERRPSAIPKTCSSFHIICKDCLPRESVYCEKGGCTIQILGKSR